MKVDDNWKQTRVLAQDLNKLLNLPTETSEKYLQILENLIVHKFLESVLSKEDNTCYEIELPYLGTLIIEVTDKGHLSTDFVVRPLFFKKLQAAYNTNESPLIQQCTDLLSEKLVKQFEEGEISG